MVMGGATEVDTPSASGAKIFSDLLQHGEVKIAGCRGELAQGNNSIADVGAAGNISIEEFAE